MFVRVGVMLLVLRCCAGEELEISDDYSETVDSRGSRGSGSYEVDKNGSKTGITKNIPVIDDFDVPPTPLNRNTSTTGESSDVTNDWPPYPLTESSTPYFRSNETSDPPETETRSEVELSEPTITFDDPKYQRPEQLYKHSVPPTPLNRNTSTAGEPSDVTNDWPQYPLTESSTFYFRSIETSAPPETETRSEFELSEPTITFDDPLGPTEPFKDTGEGTEQAPQPPVPAMSGEAGEAGEDNVILSYPFVVSVQRMGSHYASGALVHKQWVMTAAGEFYNVRESRKIFRMRLGSMDCKHGGTLIPLKSIEIHPSYVVGKPNYDLALIQLGVPAVLSLSIQPILFSDNKEDELNTKFTTTYWPRVVIKGEVLPYTAKEREKHYSMRVSTQHLISREKCSSIMNRLQELLLESSLCLMPISSHHSVCLPDVGAPVFRNDGLLWGITSGWVSPNCAQFPSPIMVTWVGSSHIRNWLYVVMTSI